MRLAKPMFLWLLLFSTRARDDPDEFFTRNKEVGCGSGDLGASGATDFQDCEYFCLVDPRCQWASFAYENSQCEWGSQPCAVNSATNIDSGLRSKANAVDMYFWANGAIRNNVLMTRTMKFTDACNWCDLAYNCTGFSFTSDTHLPKDDDQLLFYFLNIDQIIDPDGLSTDWVYYKNATLHPYCDANVSPLFAPAGKDGHVEISWTHCNSGADILVQLRNPSGDIVSTQKLSDGNSITFPTPTSGKIGDIYKLSIISQPSMIISFPIEFASNVCETDGIWNAAKAPDSVTLKCWDANSTYATGSATRACTDQGWANPDFSQCSAGRWSPTELSFLVSNLNTFYPNDEHKAQWPWYASFLFYWPGNKIYGITQGKIVGNCTSGGAEDVPGNMAGPQWRRMQIWWEIGPSGQDHCENYNITYLTSIQEDQRHGGGTFVNNWFTLINTQGTWAISYNTSTRMRVNLDTLPFREFHIPRLVITDEVEDICFSSLSKVCGTLLGQKKACLECAVQNRTSIAPECRQDSNAEDDVEFWCTCADVNDCGGDPPRPINMTSL